MTLQDLFLQSHLMKRIYWMLAANSLNLTYYGPAHGPGNIAIYLPKEKVLTMIDIAFPEWVPIHEFAIAEDIDAYFHIYDVLLSYDFTYFIGGHANLGSYEDVKNQQAYAIDIKESAAANLEAAGINRTRRAIR